MASVVGDLLRLARAGFVLAENGVRFVPPGNKIPIVLHLARIATLPWQLLTWPLRALRPASTNQARIAASLTRLGPTYIKLGQFLATRGDLVGEELAQDLLSLQDRLPPFSAEIAEDTVVSELQRPIAELFTEFGPPVAAASIAQVHKARIAPQGEDGDQRSVAVKILRPNIEQRFANDLSSFYLAARLIERFHKPSRRLRPVAVVDMLADTVELEMDLRMEAAAISEMAENTANDDGFRVPQVDWQRTARRVLTLEWVDGIAINDREALIAAGHDLEHLGNEVIRSFLRHALRDGFFHADMHQGNLFVEADGGIVAIDLGIMGRLGMMERRFLAEILYGFINRDYARAANFHFVAGYVPANHSVEVFAQALRAIGEPLMDKTAADISMGHLLGQLFQYTEVFDMQTRPELILLQKTMVVVEGVARSLDPKLNMWTAAEPVVKWWMETQMGPAGRIREAREGVENVGHFMGELPGLLRQAEQTAGAFSEMARDGVRLDDHTVQRMAREQSKSSLWTRIGIWVAALALVAIAVSQLR